MHGFLFKLVSCFRVDYLSLDIEGAEYNVLNTIDWSRIDIRYRGFHRGVFRGGSAGLCPLTGAPHELQNGGRGQTLREGLFFGASREISLTFN